MFTVRFGEKILTSSTEWDKIVFKKMFGNFGSVHLFCDFIKLFCGSIMTLEEAKQQLANTKKNITVSRISLKLMQGGSKNAFVRKAQVSFRYSGIIFETNAVVPNPNREAWSRG